MCSIMWHKMILFCSLVLMNVQYSFYLLPIVGLGLSELSLICLVKFLPNQCNFNKTQTNEMLK